MTELIGLRRREALKVAEACCRGGEARRARVGRAARLATLLDRKTRRLHSAAERLCDPPVLTLVRAEAP